MPFEVKTAYITLLTPREKEIMGLLVQGHTCKDIAKIVKGPNGFLSAKTIDTHKTRLYTKMGVHNRVQLIRAAFAIGLTTFEEWMGEFDVSAHAQPLRE